MFVLMETQNSGRVLFLTALGVLKLKRSAFARGWSENRAAFFKFFLVSSRNHVVYEKSYFNLNFSPFST